MQPPVITVHDNATSGRSKQSASVRSFLRTPEVQCEGASREDQLVHDFLARFVIAIFPDRVPKALSGGQDLSAPLLPSAWGRGVWDWMMRCPEVPSRKRKRRRYEI